MKRILTFLLLLLVALALTVSPTMSGGVGPIFLQIMICDSPPGHLDGFPCASTAEWLAVAGLLIGTLILLTMALTFPRVIRWFLGRRKHKDFDA